MIRWASGSSPEHPVASARRSSRRRSPQGIAGKLKFVAEEQLAWRDLAVSTDHDDVAV
jgi:hypothetical protein